MGRRAHQDAQEVVRPRLRPSGVASGFRARAWMRIRIMLVRMALHHLDATGVRSCAGSRHMRYGVQTRHLCCERNHTVVPREFCAKIG